MTWIKLSEDQQLQTMASVQRGDPLGANWLNQCCFNLICQRIVMWKIPLTMDLKKVKFQPGDYVIMVTNIDKPYIKYVEFVPLKQRQIFNVISSIRKKQ